MKFQSTLAAPALQFDDPVALPHRVAPQKSKPPVSENSPKTDRPASPNFDLS
jgi:hypothetical protein